MEGSGEQKSKEEQPKTKYDTNDILEVTPRDEQEVHGGASSSSRKGQKYRHTSYQIQELENLLKEVPHPDEKQRLAIGRKLNLEPNQVKFWFQNKRNQMKAQMDRHENIILKQEKDKLRLENLALKDELQSPVCKNCGGPASLDKRSIEHQNMLMENARLRDELRPINNLTRQVLYRSSSLEAVDSLPQGTTNPSNVAREMLVGSTSYSGLNPMEAGLPILENNVVSTHLPLVPPSRSELGVAVGGIEAPIESLEGNAVGIEIPMKSIKSNEYLELALSAMNELMQLGRVNTVLWNRNIECGGETLNFEEYARAFPPIIGTKPLGFISEASKASGVVPMSSLALLEALLDTDRWREMFVGMIGSSTTIDLISGGAGGSRNGALQLMQAEIQLISPSVPARVLKFIRYSQQQAEGVWAVVDLSVDAGMDGIITRRLPSGCIMHDMPNGFSKVTWIEHTEYDEKLVHHQYRRLVSSGLGFGAQKWICALLRHCEYLTAIGSPTATRGLGQSSRRCLKSLAQRMASIFCAGVCRTGDQHWDLVTYAPGMPTIMTRRGIIGSGGPFGNILSVTTSVWMPVTHRLLFELLLTKDSRCLWDVLCHENATNNVIRFSMGQDETNPNSITILSSNAQMQQKLPNPIMVLQETASDMTGSLIVYAPVDFVTVTMLMNGSDTSSIALVPSGIFIVPGYGESGAPGGERGSMVTVGFQMLLQDVATSNLKMEIIPMVNDTVSRMVLGIKEVVRSGRQGG